MAVTGRPRIRVIAAGVALGLLGCTALGGGAFGYLRYYPSYTLYKWDFDHCLYLYNRLLAGVLRGDDALRNEIATKQRLAFDHGGAAAANEMFWDIVDSRLIANAGDDAIRACHAAYTDAYRALLARPPVCRALISGTLTQDYAGVGAAAVTRARVACDAATEDGARHQSSPPPYLYGDAWQAAMARATASPAAFSPEDQAAMANPDAASDAAICAETLKFNQNVDAMGSPDGASFMRSDYEAVGQFAIIDMKPPQPAPPPNDVLHCAADGTRFVLNNFLQNGRPNSWTSLGRHGFDCGVLSAATGKRGVFRTLNDDLSEARIPNPLRALWPLAVGKSVSVTYIPVDGDADTERFSVASLARYWLPWGNVEAYAINREIWLGSYHYMVIDYWAPSLGFTIGRRSYSISGGMPDYEGQDYQIVAMVPPG